MAAPRITTSSLQRSLQPVRHRAFMPKHRQSTQCFRAPHQQILLRQQIRLLSNTAPRRKTKTVEQMKTQNRRGPFSIFSGIFFLLCGGGMWWYFQKEKEAIARKRTREASKGVGRPKVGGNFTLVDQDGNTFTQDDLKGKFSLIYFGFTHCPDICPDELDKMARMIDIVKDKRGNVLKPIFVTCDPARDTPPVVKGYLSEFHKDMIGLTGTWEQVKATCKAYRVYFSTPPHVKPGEDYLVDHSIYFYLMDPDGDFIEVVGRQHTATQGAKIIADHIDRRVGRTINQESWKQKIPTDLARAKLVKITEDNL